MKVCFENIPFIQDYLDNDTLHGNKETRFFHEKFFIFFWKIFIALTSNKSQPQFTFFF